jgi:hypothetical protein
MTGTGLPQLAWRKSSFSNNNGGCVEVAFLGDGGVALRDSKAGGTGPVLRYTAAEWRAFLAGVASGEFTRS